MVIAVSVVVVTCPLAWLDGVWPLDGIVAEVVSRAETVKPVRVRSWLVPVMRTTTTGQYC